MEPVPTSADYHARARWVRMCMALLVLQEDFRVAREIASTMPRKVRAGENSPRLC